MISSLFDVRRLLSDVRKRLLYTRRPILTAPKVEGLPEGLEPDIINQICRDYFDGPLASVVHFHLSGWKSYGAYRLIGKTAPGTEVRLIFKVDHYSLEEHPGLAGLPIQLGPSEFRVYSQPGSALAPFLPKVYLAEERIPGLEYRYILEDLRGEYERPIYDEKKAHAAALLPRVHQALREWEQEVRPQGLIQYGPEFSRKIQTYAREELEKLQQQVDLPTLDTTLKRWPEIAAVHLNPEFKQETGRQPIHGDANFTNIHLHKKDPRGIKLVDWEWAGVGTPASDLASLLKGAGLLIEMEAIKQFTKASAKGNAHAWVNRKQFERLYLWCHLERAILDAGYLSAQRIKNEKIGNMNLSVSVEQSLKRILNTVQQLSS